MPFEPNPILLFELRQVVRNRSVLVLLTLYLAAMVLLSGFALMFPTNFGPPGARPPAFLRNYSQVSEQLTLLLFLTYYSFTTVTLVGFAAFRTATDRLRENPAYDTALPAHRLVLGKLLFGTVVSLLFLSITCPFLTVVYMMRGVDVRLFFWAAFYFFCMTQLQYFVTVTLFSGAKTVARTAMLLLPAVFIQFFMALFSVTQIPEMIYHINMMNPRNEPAAMLAMLFLVAGVPMLILFLVCCVQFSPESSNRMMPVRITLTAIQILLSLFLVGVAVDSSMKGTTGYSDGYSYAVVPNMLYWFTFPYLFAVFICERETWSPRIRRQIPRSELRRMLAFPFFTGAPNAIVWSLLSLLLITPLPVIVHLLTGGSFPGHIMAGVFGGFSFGLLFFDYAATTLLLYNLLFHRWLSCLLSRQWMWLPLFLLLAVPVLGFFFLTVAARLVAGVSIELNVMPFLPLPWFPESTAFVITQWMIALIWTAVLVVTGLPWLRRHYREFQPLDPMARQEKEPEASASG